jgi:hypothetical protein
VIATCEATRRPALPPNEKRIWVIDVREEWRPVTVSSFPEPTPPGGGSYYDLPGLFGPHNLHENPPGSFESEELIFGTYNNAGVRAWDISDPFRPEGVAHFVWPTPEGCEAPHANDLYVDVDRHVYVTDRRGGGLYILEFTG